MATSNLFIPSGQYLNCARERNVDVSQVLQFFFGKATAFIAAKANCYLFLVNSQINFTCHSASNNWTRPPTSKNNWTLDCEKTEEKYLQAKLMVVVGWCVGKPEVVGGFGLHLASRRWRGILWITEPLPWQPRGWGVGSKVVGGGHAHLMP